MQPIVLLAASTWWPLSAQLAIALRKHGCLVKTVCPPGHPLRYVRGIRDHRSYNSIGSLSALRSAIYAADPVMIIPCDDAVVWQLHQLYKDEPRLRELISRSLGSEADFETVRCREKLQQVALDLHIRVPRTDPVRTHQDLRVSFERAAGGVAVLKQDGTWGGNGVRVVRSKAEADDAFTSMLRPTSKTTAFKRMVINHDPTALWLGRNLKQPAVTLQEFIPGRPANLMMTCWQGRVLGTVAVEVLWSLGATGAAMVVRLIEHDEINQAACKLARKLNLSGFHGVDFMLDANSGLPYLIELNPRCTQLGHLPMAGWGDLAGLLGRQLGADISSSSEESLTAGLSPGDTIAFFPKASLARVSSGYVREGYQDTPWEEPALVRELLRESWPERQLLTRFYHWLRPPLQQQPKAFFDSGTAIEAINVQADQPRAPYVLERSGL